MSDSQQGGASRGNRAPVAASRIGPSGPPGGFEAPQPPEGDGSGRRIADAVRRRPGAESRDSADTSSGPPRRRRSVDVSTLASLALALPWFFYSVLVVAFIGLAAGTLLGNTTAVSVAVMVAWLLSGALIFAGPVEVFLARTFLRARRPTPGERERLDHAWHDVRTAAGIPRGRYQLFVQDTDALNAYAASGHIVTVTRKVLDAMPHHQLAAVLAHEFGHHLGGHAWGNLLAYWYSLPSRLLNRVLRFLIRLFVSVFSFVIAMAARLPALALVFAHILTWMLVAFALFVVVMLMITAVESGQAWAPPALVLFLLTPLILPWLARRSEFRADRVAAELGYGHALIEVFEDWLRQGMDDARTHAVLRARLFSTHPALAARIKKLDAYLRKQQ